MSGDNNGLDYLCLDGRAERLPIVKTYEQLSHWHERTKKDESILNDSDAIFELNNIAEGSLIVIDEAWKLWPASGRGAVSEDIE
jgi:zona occludens toxin